jgi:uncharacterized membrane protein YfcA
MKKTSKLLIGLGAGLLNGLFGSGGGVVTVPLLQTCTDPPLEQRKCHATSVVLIFVLSFVSAVMYALHDKLEYGKALSFVPAGLAGAFVGARLLRKVKNSALRRIFGAVIIASAVRLFTV